MRKRISNLILVELTAATAFALYCAIRGYHKQFSDALMMYLICISTYTALNINRKE